VITLPGGMREVHAKCVKISRITPVAYAFSLGFR
jgi:hypothetical protein